MIIAARRYVPETRLADVESRKHVADVGMQPYVYNSASQVLVSYDNAESLGAFISKDCIRFMLNSFFNKPVQSSGKGAIRECK